MVQADPAGPQTTRWILSSFVRVTPGLPGHWRVSTIVAAKRRRWEMPTALVRALLEVARRPLELPELARQMSERSSVTNEQAHELLEALREGKVLVAPHDVEHLRVARLTNAWAERGWREATDYHLATYDYPFLDYADAAEVRKDVAIMNEFSVEEADVDRFHSPQGERFACPTVDEAVARLQLPVESQPPPPDPAKPLQFAILAALLSAAVGVRGQRSTPYRTSAALLLKTVPSGGARHPTECYLYVRRVQGLEPGLYLFVGPEHALVRLSDVTNDKEVVEMLRDVPESDAAAYLVLSSRTCRNRYRYREPRTFRTIFLDIGHVLGNFGLVGQALGVRTRYLPEVRVASLEALLGVQAYEECVICAVALNSSVSGAML